MALMAFDGFDHYSAPTDFLSRTGFLQYQTPGAFQPTISFVAGRNGIGKAVKLANNNGILGNCATRAVWGARNAESFFGFGFLIPSSTLGNPTTCRFYLMDTVAGSPQLTVIFNGNNYSIHILRGSESGTSLYLSANNVWTGDVWNFIEFHVLVDGAAGAVDVHVNSVSKAAVSGVNTQATANAWSDALDIMPGPTIGITTTTFVEMDDLYYNDATMGSGLTPANTFLGDSAVRTLFATGNDAVQWTPLANSNWQEISEVAMDSDTSYNFSSTVGQQDTFTFQPLTAAITTLYGVQLTYAARKDDGGARSLKSVVKISGTSYFGATNSLASNYAYFTDLWVLNPATSLNWTPTDVNSAEYGYNLVA